MACGVSPVRYRSNLHFYPKEAKMLAMNVLGSVRKECGKGASMNSVIKRTAALTNVSARTLYKWMSEHDKGGKVLSPKKLRFGGRGRERKKKMDDFDLGVLRRIVHSFFKKKEIPTVRRLTDHYKEDESLPCVSQSTMHRMLRQIGFKYKKRSRNALLIEATHIVQWRRKYLRQIKELRRQGRPIFYTDETWVNAGHTVSRVWVDENVKTTDDVKNTGLSTGLPNPSGKGGRLIITHCGNENGFVSGAGEVFRARKGTADYHDEMDGVHYEKWFKEKLLPGLPPNSVIVIDNAPYHSVKLEKVPRMSTLKKDMQAWLSLKGVAWSSDMVKAELMKLVETVKTGGDKFRIDSIAAEAGHTVVRLPPYHCQLNPIELVWSDLKHYVATENGDFKMHGLDVLVWKGMEQVGVRKWKRYVDHVIREEEEMRELDHVVDVLVDSHQPVIVALGEDTSNDESSMDDENFEFGPFG